MAFELPDLPYEYNALEPHIDEQTMRIHHDKHHGGYVKKLNDALADLPDWQNKSIEKVLQGLDQLPEEVVTRVRNNGGGHYNHSLFWTLMKPNGGGQPQGELVEAINSTFGSFEEFKKQFTGAATNLFGSGWVWLAAADGEKLDLHTMPLQDNPIMHGHKPILGLDVWEHAYYLKYQNVRPNYIDAWWNVVNWSEAERLFGEVKKAK